MKIIQEIIVKCKQAQVDNTEYACLKAMTLFKTCMTPFFYWIYLEFIFLEINFYSNFFKALATSIDTKNNTTSSSSSSLSSSMMNTSSSSLSLLPNVNENEPLDEDDNESKMANDKQPTLRDIENIASFQEQTQVTLSKYDLHVYPSQPFRFGQLVLLMPLLRSVSSQTIEQVFFKKTIGNISIERVILDMYKSPMAN